MSSKLSKHNEEVLLKLARESIKNYLDKNEKLNVPDSNMPSWSKEQRAVFVTLTIDKELRGCIGNLFPVGELYKSVVDNAVNAAFFDPRFKKLEKKEFDKIKIEISILTIPEELNYKDSDDLLKKLLPNKHGVTLNKNNRSATFLPQVWEQLPKKEDFLMHLSLKAGLGMNGWKDHPRVELYEVEEFEEK